MNQDQTIGFRILRNKTEQVTHPRNYYRFHLWLKKNEEGKEKAYALCESLTGGTVTELRSEYVEFIDQEHYRDILLSIKNEKKRNNG